MNQRINQKFINKYDRIIFTQPLAHDKYIKQIYIKEGNTNKWKVVYKSNSIHHICPYDGVFRNCADCGAIDEDFDVKFCTNKTEIVGAGALIERIYKCQDAGLKVDFLYNEDILEE